MTPSHVRLAPRSALRDSMLTTSIALALCRAFVTSLTAEAHLKLLTRIFQTVEQDTNQVVKIKYIHGSGYEIFTFDEHKGQALGKHVSLGSFECLKLICVPRIWSMAPETG